MVSEAPHANWSSWARLQAPSTERRPRGIPPALTRAARTPTPRLRLGFSALSGYDGGVYRRALEQYALSVEQRTPEVSADAYHYVLFHEKVMGRFRRLAQAQELFKRLRAELGVQAVEAPPPDLEDIRRREQETIPNKRLIWTDEDLSRVSKATAGKKGTRSGGR